jgi:hypothetical protein
MNKVARLRVGHGFRFHFFNRMRDAAESDFLNSISPRHVFCASIFMYGQSWWKWGGHPPDRTSFVCCACVVADSSHRIPIQRHPSPLFRPSIHCPQYQEFFWMNDIRPTNNWSFACPQLHRRTEPLADCGVEPSTVVWPAGFWPLPNRQGRYSL